MTLKSNHQIRVEALHDGIRKLQPHTPPDPPIPTFPDEYNGRLTRARLLFEEAIETIEALGFHVMAHPAFGKGAIVLNKNPDSVGWLPCAPASLPALAKELSDVLVVCTGTLSHCGIPDDALLELVDRNNLQKIHSGFVDSFGKLHKHARHPKPDIENLLRSLGWSG